MVIYGPIINLPASDAGTISNWAVSPELIMQNGDKISFLHPCRIIFL